MFKYFKKWRYYGLDRNEYKTCIKASYNYNLHALCWANLVFFVLAVLFSVFPVITEKNYVKAGFYLESAALALILFFLALSRKRKLIDTKITSSAFLYTMILLYFVNVMFFGLYLAVWAEPEKIAGSFIGILICVLFFFNISPVLYLCLMVSILIVYIAAIVNVKIPSVWNYDIQNAFFAAAMGLSIGWHIIMNRITMISNTRKLKDENTIDELTKLKNRRDFMNTFQRFLAFHRQTDKFLCIALVDIDCFKNYNDHYGHPQGDECLRMIGKAFNELSKNDGIYTARIGGEEFALLWHSENSTDVKNVGLRINRIIRDLNIPHEKSIVVPYVTVSVGIHAAECGMPHDIKDLYNLADKALYAAKHNGRNCTIVD